MFDILAIVGSKDWPPGSEHVVKEIIRERLTASRPDLVISGGARGVDSWGAQVARELEIPCDDLNYLPENRRWEPRGFKARNIKMGKACTRLLAIRSSTSRTFGSGWTANYARDLGKPVEMIVL